MSDLDSLSVTATRRGLSLWFAIVPMVGLLAVVFMVLASRSAPEARPAPPVDLSTCDWGSPSVWCQDHGPPVLRGLPPVDAVARAIGVQLGGLITDDVARVEWADADERTRGPWRPAVSAYPDPGLRPFVADDEAWYALQRALVDPASSAAMWDPISDALVLVLGERPPWRARSTSSWERRFEEVERARRSLTAHQLVDARRQAWRRDVVDWQRRVDHQARQQWTLQVLGASGVFLFPLLGAFAFHLRRTSVQVRLTRTHLWIGGDPVLLTELPVEADRLRAVLDGLLPTGFRIGHDEEGFFEALLRAVRARHDAEDRPEARSRLERLGTSSARIVG